MAAVHAVQGNMPAAVTGQAEFLLFASQKVYEYRSLLKWVETPAVFNAMANAAMPHFRDHERLFDL